MPRSKFYAVRRGREGAKIYDNWSECEGNVKGWGNARYKSFANREEAQGWIQDFHSVSQQFHPQLNISAQPTPAPETPPDIPHVEPFTEDFIPLPSSPEAHTIDSSTVCFSEEQEHILELVQRGHNIFFTGSAGTGKSVLLRQIIRHFGGRVSAQLAITASTGIAAVNIGGTTLHSFAGIGLGTESVELLEEKITKNKKSKRRWRDTQTLIIDELSMVDGVLFDKLELIARTIRGNNRPFGGIQLILTGDFCQLPPIPSRQGGISRPILFAFEARSWQKCFNEETSGVPAVHRLTKVFRQKDQAFVDLLNSMRDGQIDAASSAKLQDLSRPVHYRDGLEPCELFPLRKQVREANETRLRRLTGISQPFVAMDVGGYDVYDRHVGLDQATKLLDRVMAPQTIELKVGAQVMLIKNLVQGRLVNGSLGQVVGFQSLSEARGRHTEIAEVDKSKDPVTIQGQNHGSGPVEDNQVEPVDTSWPVVRFINGQTLLLTPVEFEVVNVLGKMEARRDQVPLILAWALSIHKSQGQTLERVKVDLGGVFAEGQAYVALSRATSLEGIQVLNFHPSKVMAHPRVLAWHQRLGNHATQPSPIPSVPEPFDEFDEFDEFDDEEAMARYHSVAL